MTRNKKNKDIFLIKLICIFEIKVNFIVHQCVLELQKLVNHYFQYVNNQILKK